MNIWALALKICGWKVDISAPKRNKCVICVAPHTSNLDFPLGLAAYKSLGREANFLMKKFWFFFPLSILLKKLGGIPVERSRNTSLVDRIINMFNSRSYLNLAVTPEGTRSRNDDWRTGFLRIAYGAKVPLQLGVIDYSEKRIIVADEIALTGDVAIDMSAVRNYYSRFKNAARYPENFA